MTTVLCSMTAVICCLLGPVVPVRGHAQMNDQSVIKQEKKQAKLEARKAQVRRKQEEKAERAHRKLLAEQEREREDVEANIPAWITCRCTMEQVRNALANKMISRGFGVAADATYQLSFWREITGGTGFLTQFLLGNAYSGTPKQVITFTLAPYQDQVTVRASAAVTVRMPLGNVNSIDMTLNKNWKKDLQVFLNSLFQP